MKSFAGTAAALLALALLGAQAASAADLVLRWVKADGSVVSEKTLTTKEVEALPQTSFATNTPWTTKVTEFTGPELAELVKLGPGNAVSANVIALNDYTSEVPAEDWVEHGATLAVRTDGELMKIRDKGPYWLMYPIDSDPRVLNTQLYHSRMVWQVKSIEFVVE